MPYHPSILPSFFINEPPYALIAKTKSNQSQGPEATLSCLISRYQWEGRCLRFKASVFKPYHVLCQLGLGLDNIEGVEAKFLERTFRLS